jgi:hypothetical protein
MHHPGTENITISIRGAAGMSFSYILGVDKSWWKEEIAAQVAPF